MNKKIFAAAAAVAVTAGGAAAIIANASSAKAEEDVSYREYSVSKGNITVGTEESGTLSLDREYVSFPCTAEVTEVYVKTGTSVKEDDALLKVDPDDVAKAKKQYELKLRSAQNALDEAKDNLTSGTLKAEQELESAKLKGTSAQSEYELYLSKQETEKETSAKNLADLKKQLEEYENMTLTYDDDYAKLTAYENKLSALEADHKAMEKQYREYQKTDTANNEALEVIKDEYSAYTEKISDTSEKINSLKQAYEEAKAAYEQAQSEYEDAKEAYNDSVYISTSSSDNSSTTQNSQNSNTSAESKYEAASAALTKAYNTYSAAKTAYSGYYVTLGEQISDKIEDYEDKISAAAKLLREGGLVAVPTETVYGLGANGLDGEAVKRIFEAKGRPQDNPLIIHVTGAQWLPRYCADVPPLAYVLARKFWPGPLTMILKRRPIIPDETTAGLDTVAVRCPNHPVTLAIIREAGVPIAAPSANLSGRPSCTTAQDVLEDMDGRISGVVDGGPCAVGVESTIIDLTPLWCVAVPMAALTALVLEAPLPLVCLGIYSENICKMPLGVIRLRSRKWINDVTKGACA